MPKRSKLSDADKKDIRDMYSTSIDRAVIAEKYGISQKYVSTICYGYEGNGHYVSRIDRMLSAGITPQMIDEVRQRIHPGMTVICLDKIEEGNGRAAGVKRGRSRVIGTYPYIFTVKRPYGVESFTYVDLIRHDGVRLKEN